MTANTIQVGSFEVNCTILTENGKAWAVDPGSEETRISALVKKSGAELAGILLTHGHFDHIGAVSALQKRWGEVPVYVDDRDRVVLTHPLNSFEPDYPPQPAPANMHAASENPVAEVVETPGHTPGGVCYYIPAEGLLLSGDTLFAGSVGRTDLPGGDMGTLMKSLSKLTALPDDTRVVPGHGPATSVATEKRVNPFLSGLA